jgi:hypothetical protein
MTRKGEINVRKFKRAMILLKADEGYPDDAGARYLALWWKCSGDEAMLSDGSMTTTGNWEGYLALYITRRFILT